MGDSSSSSTTAIQPGDVIKPFVDQALAARLLGEVYGLKATTMKEFVSYDDKNFFFKADPDSVDSPHLSADDLCPDGYVLKVTNSNDSKDPESFQAQNLMIQFLGDHGMPAPLPLKNKEGTWQCLRTLDCPLGEGKVEQREYLVRCLKFLPGTILFDVEPWTTEHFFQCGAFIARMDTALKAFWDKGFEKRDSIWFLSSVPKLPEFLYVIKDEKRRALLEEIVDAFNADVVPIAKDLERGVIHGDFNEQNILMRPKEGSPNEYEVHAAIDFGDANVAPLVYELGTTIMYMMTKCTVIHPNLVGGHVIAGYMTERALPNQELDALRTLVAARYAQSLGLGAYTHAQDPENDYVVTTAKTGWRTIAEFWATPKEELYKSWTEIIDSYKK